MNHPLQSPVYTDSTRRKSGEWWSKFFLAAHASLLLSIKPVHAASVTVITHGFSSSVTDWIIPMAQKVPEYYRFLGTNSTCYEIYFVQDAQGKYVPTQSRIGGVAT